LQIQQLTQINYNTFLISQFNRPYDRKSVDRPRNHNLRDSGAIEERADMIFLLWWERKMKLESLSRFDGDNPEKIDIDITNRRTVQPVERVGMYILSTISGFSSRKIKINMVYL